MGRHTLRFNIFKFTEIDKFSTFAITLHDTEVWKYILN